MRATAATNALDNGADIAKVQDGLATRTFKRLGFMIGGNRVRRIRRRFEWRIEVGDSLSY